MKVLKEPPKEDWKIEEYCTAVGHGGYGCGALLEIERDDIFYSFTKRRDSDGDEYYQTHYFFSCPLCHQQTNIIRNEIPVKIEHYILNNKKKRKNKRI